MLQENSLAGLLRRINNYSVKSFSDRLLLQKTVYLMQEFGVPLDYRFTWYFHGPYCPSLTKQFYEIGEINERFEIRKFKDQQCEDNFKKLLTFLGDRKKDEKWLEAIASIHYLHKLKPKLDDERLITKFLELKPRYSKKTAQDALQKLKESGLF
jgi:uncharacterized protein YwgA